VLIIFAAPLPEIATDTIYFCNEDVGKGALIAVDELTTSEIIEDELFSKLIDIVEPIEFSALGVPF